MRKQRIFDLIVDLSLNFEPLPLYGAGKLMKNLNVHLSRNLCLAILEDDFARRGTMDEHRLPGMVLSMMASGNIYTEAIKRLKYLKIRFGCSDIPINF